MDIIAAAEGGKRRYLNQLAKPGSGAAQVSAAQKQECITVLALCTADTVSHDKPAWKAIKFCMVWMFSMQRPENNEKRYFLNEIEDVSKISPPLSEQIKYALDSWNIPKMCGKIC